MARNYPCQACNGSGKMKVTVRSATDKTVVDMPCLDCNGSGKSSLSPAKQREKKEAFKALWCRCAASSGSIYVPDTPTSKHHWVCQDCEKVTQIG